MKECKYFLDSNIFLRLIVEDHSGMFKECEELLEIIKQGETKAYTSHLVLAEVCWVCRKIYKIEKQRTTEFLRKIANFKHLKFIENYDGNLAIEFYNKHTIKFIDALIASNPQIQKKEMFIVSYDKDFDKLGLIRREPRQIIKK